MAASFFEFDLVAHRLDRLDVRADEGDARLGERAGEGRVLRKKAIAGMDGVGAGLLGRGNDLADVEIGLAGGGRADAYRLIRHLNMERVSVCVGIDRDRGDTKPPCRLHDTAGDFSTIGDEKFG